VQLNLDLDDVKNQNVDAMSDADAEISNLEKEI
jgi:hypothetical protein